MRPGRYQCAKDCGDSGFTLIELLVGSIVFVTVVGVLLSFLGKDEKAREVSYHVLESRQSARSALEFMVSEIRMAGSGIDIPVVTSTATGDSLVLYPITPDSVGGRPEKITLLGKFEGVETTVRVKLQNAGDDTQVESAAGFEAGDLVIITDGSFANLFEVTGVDEGSRKLEHGVSSQYNQPAGHTPWPVGGYEVGSQVFKVDVVSYYVNRDDTTCLTIVRKSGTEEPRVISDYITELEIEYELEDHTVVTAPEYPSLIRRVIVTIEAASDEPSQEHVTRLVSAAKPRCL